jgi:hypothetical protein
VFDFSICVVFLASQSVHNANFVKLRFQISIYWCIYCLLNVFSFTYYEMCFWFYGKFGRIIVLLWIHKMYRKLSYKFYLYYFYGLIFYLYRKIIMKIIHDKIAFCLLSIKKKNGLIVAHPFLRKHQKGYNMNQLFGTLVGSMFIHPSFSCIELSNDKQTCNLAYISRTFHYLICKILDFHFPIYTY